MAQSAAFYIAKTTIGGEVFYIWLKKRRARFALSKRPSAATAF
jgi:hypothetical protein